MKVTYYPETDTLYIDLSSRKGSDAVEVAADVVVDIDEDGTPVGIEIEHASTNVDLSTLEAKAIGLIPSR